MIARFKFIVERYPFLAFVYRSIRDAWIMRTHKLQTTPNGFGFMGCLPMQDGSFEPKETALIKRKLTETDVFIDVGANIGYYTCIARSLGKYTITIEPLPENLLYLYANLRGNGWHDVEVWPVGVGEHPGLTTLYGGTTGASLIKEWAGSSAALCRTIPISTLDIILGERFVGKRLLIKIDVEGAEYEVVRGAARTLARTPGSQWVLEICLTENFPSGINPHFEEIFHLFWDHGYVARVVGDDNRVVTPEAVKRWARNCQRDFGSVSYFFEQNSPKL
ncbi:MAG: FkbM family methyltransferase [Deltaproteobacteria bacterium]